MISYDKKSKCFRGNMEKGLYLPQYQNPNIFFLKKFSKEDIAAATQHRIEEE